MTPLFPTLPEQHAPLPHDQAVLLADLPIWPTQQEVPERDYAACRALERRGLIKVAREKSDPIAIAPTWYAGRLPGICPCGSYIKDRLFLLCEPCWADFHKDEQPLPPWLS